MTDNNEHGSPMHMGLTGHFSADDLHDLLGVMSDHGGHQESDGESLSLSQYALHHGTESNNNHSSQASTTRNEKPTSDSEQQQAEDKASYPTSGADDIPEDAKAQARSERKRSREKQRRSDVNKQFQDLTTLLQKIENEDLGEGDVKNGTAAARITFNPSNRVDLIAKTIILLERLSDSNKRRKTEIASLQQQLEEAKKAGEDTAARLKEAMLAPPAPPSNKQVMMMVPMMMSTDGSGGMTSMMSPYMQQPAFCPMPGQMAAMPAPASMNTSGPAPSVASMPGTQAQGQAPNAPGPAPVPMMAHQQVAMHQHHQQPQQQQQHHQHAQPQHHQMQMHPSGYPFMMPAGMSQGGFMMQMPTPGHPMTSQGMTMVPQPAMPAMHATTSRDSQNSSQEQKDASSSNLSGGNLAHCA